MEENRTVIIQPSAIDLEKQRPDAVILYTRYGTFVCEKDYRKILDDGRIEFKLKAKR